MANIDFLGLVDSCLCTNIRKLSRVITRIYDTYLEPSNININQLGLLLTIKGMNEDRKEDDPPTIGEIGQRLVMEKSTLSRNLRVLEDGGLIQMERHPDNRTQKSARITPRGIEVVFDAYAYWDEVQSKIRTGFGTEQFTQLIILLNQLEQVMKTEFPEELS